MIKYYFTDTHDFNYQVNESSENNGFLKLEGVFQRAEAKNANGRIYPKHLLEREIKRCGMTLSERRMLGEIDHPPDPKIHLDKASHVITELSMDKNGVVHGKLEVLKTPAGRLLEGLIQSGVKLGISSRGTGSVKEDRDQGANVVQEDFSLITFDIVADPSTPGAWPEVVREWKEDGHVVTTETKKLERDEDALNKVLLYAAKKIFK